MSNFSEAMKIKNPSDIKKILDGVPTCFYGPSDDQIKNVMEIRIEGAALQDFLTERLWRAFSFDCGLEWMNVNEQNIKKYTLWLER
jgi:hypothetical protein